MRSFKPLALLLLASLPLFLNSCGSAPVDKKNQMVVSVRDQKMLLVRDGKPVKAYPVSTSKFGLGIVTRILWLSGRDNHNRNTFGRCVYIHGTPAENKIGRPASYGCIRMKSATEEDRATKIALTQPAGKPFLINPSGIRT